MSDFVLRPEQQFIVDDYTGGYAIISAVPGAGKTTTLCALAAKLIASIQPRQRVVIVTYQNAAVANFQRAVTRRLEERGEPPRGFVVRTLHSLANEVLQSVRHRAELDIGVRVIDESDAQRLLDEAIIAMKVKHRDLLSDLLIDDEAAARSRFPQGDNGLFREVVTVALRELRTIAPDIAAFRERTDGYGRWLPFVLDVSCAYQQALREQGLLDYDDLIVRAVDALEHDPDLCQRLRHRWPYLLEDEAQDSNPLLERMLRLIAGADGNLLRVGDANQSILTTFTASSVEGFRRWLADDQVQQYILTVSNRSTEPIIALANRFVRRVHDEFPVEEARSALQQQEIRPVIDQDGNLSNPPTPSDSGLGLVAREFHQTEDERDEVLGRALAYLRRHPGRTVAVLVGSKDNGYEYAEIAREMGFPDDRIIRLLSDRDGRQVGLINKIIPIIDFLGDPDQEYWLQDALALFSTGDDDRVVEALKALKHRPGVSLGDVLFPPGGGNLETALDLPEGLLPQERQTVRRLQAVSGWLENRHSQPGELLSLIAATVELDEQERQLMDAIVSTIESVTPDPQQSRLAHLRALLKELQGRQRRLRGTYDQHEIRIEPGTLTVSTRHQAKGLEWDVVFAIGCDDFWFKGTTDYPRRTMRAHLGQFDPVLVARTELQFAAEGRWSYPSDEDLSRVTRQQAIDEVSEGLRVLYVTITRARSAIWLSWHRDGTYNDQRSPRQESPVFPLLAALIDDVQKEAASVAAG